MCRQFRVRGRVQGVFFRASTQEKAIPLGLNGHALNMPDGSVEVLACGRNEAIEELLSWLREGPPMASVSVLEEKEIDCSRPDGFRAG